MGFKSTWRGAVRLWKKLPPWAEFGLVGIIAVGFVVFGAGIVWATIMPLPAINNFENRQVAESTKIYDRTGNVVLYDVHGSIRRTAVPLDEISPFVRNATIAIEDATFYQHIGFRPLAFMRAALVNITTGSYSQGGSTITQQVVKNALLTQKKTVGRKLEEIILALRLERVYSKDQILNTYLNETSYGGTIYGVEEASNYYFGVTAKDLDLAQGAYLAALPQAPTYYSPYGNHRDALDRRKNLVLASMLRNGFITQEEHDQAKAEKVDFMDEREAGIKAPHFVFYIREYLEEKYGPEAVAQGGLHVVTTLDYDLQQKAQASVDKFGKTMMQNFNASNEGVVAVDPKTGQILAMVGSRDYFNDEIDGQVNVTTARRQPGSSFKPFVYATAFDKGYTPDTVVFDLQTQFSTACSPQDFTNDTPPCYSPQNFDGKFKGPMKLRDAIAQSQNVPSVKTLYLAGIQDSIETARKLGITTLENAARYGLTLVLGGGEVELVEMTSAYGVFANDGVRNPATGILRVEDNAGNVLEEFKQEGTQVLEPQTVRLINDVLSDNVARIPEFGVNSPLYFDGYDVADKTGTTNDFHDVWVIGYTPGIAVGAWAGNNDNSAMERRIAAFIIAPMWHDFMAKALEKYSSPSDTFPSPAPDAEVATLAPVLRGEWNTDPSQGVHDILYWVNKNDPRGGRPANPWADSQAAYWDYPVQLWAGGQGQPASSTPGSPSPAGTGIQTGFHITYPQEGAWLTFGAAVSFTSAANTPQMITGVTYFVNGVAIGQATQMPYIVAYQPTIRGASTLRVVAQHIDGSSEEQTMTFTVQ